MDASSFLLISNRFMRVLKYHAANESWTEVRALDGKWKNAAATLVTRESFQECRKDEGASQEVPDEGRGDVDSGTTTSTMPRRGLFDCEARIKSMLRWCQNMD